MSKTRRSPRPAKERALDEIYAEIPSIPDCTGACASSCGPIAMFAGEWTRIKRAKGHTPRLRPPSLTCPMLSPNGACTVYSVRPFICRLWGTTPALKCPEGCEPERWLTKEEAHEIYGRVREITGPAIDGPMGRGTGALTELVDLWKGFALDEREQRQNLMKRIEEAARGSAT